MSIDLWQIGKPGGTLGEEYPTTGGWREVFDYTVGTDDDPINHPNAPYQITVPQSNRDSNKNHRLSTDRFNIHFTLGRDYAEDQLTLFYDLYGTETDTLTLDGQFLKEIRGTGEAKLQRHTLSLPSISNGQHTLSITTKGGVGGHHCIDYLKLTYNGDVNQQPMHLVLKATDIWLDTRVYVTAGEALIITATGTWKVDQEPATPEVTADGFVGFQLPGTVLPTADFGSLIGRIGEYGTPFFVGSTFNAPSPSSGRLYLQINDVVGTLDDNAGELSVSVEN